MSQTSRRRCCQDPPGGSHGRVIQGSDRMAQSHGAGHRNLRRHLSLSARRALQANQPASKSRRLGSQQYCGRASPFLPKRVPSFPEPCARLTGRDRNSTDDCPKSGIPSSEASEIPARSHGRVRQSPKRPDRIDKIRSLSLTRAKPGLAFSENREQRTENREPRTENREPRTENREPRTENREPRTENREPRTEN